MLSTELPPESSAVLTYATPTPRVGPLETLRPLAWVALFLAFTRCAQYGPLLVDQFNKMRLGYALETSDLGLASGYLVAGGLSLVGGIALLARRQVSLTLLYYGELIAFGMTAFMPFVLYGLRLHVEGFDLDWSSWRNVQEWVMSLTYYYLTPVALPLTIVLLCRSARHTRMI